MAAAVKPSGFSFANRSFFIGLILGAALAAASVDYYHNAKHAKLLAQSPMNVPKTEMHHYDFDDILRNNGEVPVPLTPPIEPSAAAGQPPPQQPPAPTKNNPAQNNSSAEMSPPSALKPAAPVEHTAANKSVQPLAEEVVTAAPTKVHEPIKTAVTPTAYAVHVQMFSRFEAAHALRQQLLSLGYESFIKKTRPQDAVLYLVWMGPFDRLRADSIQTDLKQNGVFSGSLVAINE